MLHQNFNHDDERYLNYRIKKAVQFIENVLWQNRSRFLDQLNFSLVLAIAKAKELEHAAAPFTPVYRSFRELTSALQELPARRSAQLQAEVAIDEIKAYYALDKLTLIRKDKSFSQRAE